MLVNVMVEPEGARSGTLSHAPPVTAAAAKSETRPIRGPEPNACVLYHQTAKHFNLMRLGGQLKSGEGGYAMAALLVAWA